nr:chaperone protein DnaJ 2-like [Nerophis lumbriciformis]
MRANDSSFLQSAALTQNKESSDFTIAHGGPVLDYKDYYKTLSISKGASADEIQKAYRKLARKHHPDVNQGNAESEEKFKEISEAYEVLKDPQKRATYDQFGSAWKGRGGRGGPPPGFEGFDFGGMGGGMGGDSGFSSFFDMLFNSRGGGPGAGGNPFGGGGQFGGFGGGGRPQGKGSDQEASLKLSLEQAAAGGGRELTLTDPATGRARTVSVQLPKGVRAGQKIRLAGRGGQGFANAPAGDLYLKVEMLPHAHFELDGLNLRGPLPVTPWQAALGGQATVRTLEGPVTVKIPSGSSSGRKIRLKGRGFPNPKGQPGDLYAEIKVMVPTELTERERELLEELAEVSSFAPE